MMQRKNVRLENRAIEHFGANDTNEGNAAEVVLALQVRDHFIIPTPHNTHTMF